jgi:hypothetical protein
MVRVMGDAFLPAFDAPAAIASSTTAERTNTPNRRLFTVPSL